MGRVQEYRTSEVRKIFLRRDDKQSPFGFKFISGQDEQGIYISFIERGGIADHGGELLVGDQLLWVSI